MIEQIIRKEKRAYCKKEHPDIYDNPTKIMDEYIIWPSKGKSYKRWRGSKYAWLQQMNTNKGETGEKIYVSYKKEIYDVIKGKQGVDGCDYIIGGIPYEIKTSCVNVADLFTFNNWRFHGTEKPNEWKFGVLIFITPDEFYPCEIERDLLLNYVNDPSIHEVFRGKVHKENTFHIFIKGPEIPKHLFPSTLIQKRVKTPAEKFGF